jgi:hypothetical protein
LISQSEDQQQSKDSRKAIKNPSIIMSTNNKTPMKHNTRRSSNGTGNRNANANANGNNKPLPIVAAKNQVCSLLGKRTT